MNYKDKRLTFIRKLKEYYLNRYLKYIREEIRIKDEIAQEERSEE